MKLNLNNYRLRKYQRITHQVFKLQSKYAAMSDNQLKDQTNHFRKRLADGESLNELLPEAYATICEADFRVLGMRPFENQVLGAVVLHYGNVAEMKTGEGKTLTATMPMYLNGLTGPGNFLVTANDYLANRDADEIGKVYQWMGLTIASGAVSEGEANKKEIYNHDIVYTTNSNLGFDYLIDNLADSAEDKNLQQLTFALVDEVDSVLLDLAQTPLIISGAPRVQSNLFVSTDQVVKNLDPAVDYELSEDTKKVWFTSQGIKNLEKYLGVTGILSEKWSDLYRHLVLALRANKLLRANLDYVVVDGEIKLLDVENGREMEGMKLEAGMHQAIEAKEEVPISSQSRAMASITLQNFFKMFQKLAGMTGTAKTSEKEFESVYNMPVLQIPTHKPNIRVDHPDLVYASMEEKINASVEMIEVAHKIGRPILIETGSVSLSRLYSRVLLQHRIVHNVLNAQSESKEAQIIAEAGQPGAVTVATSMAGRGTDIRLGKHIQELGGLLVLGTERMANKRVDDQLRGRAGRQGDPGESRFLVSLDDKVIIENGPDWIETYRSQQQNRARRHARVGQPITGWRVHKIVDRAQQVSDASGADARKNGIKMDDILRIQRDLVYNFRDEIMARPSLSDYVTKILNNVLIEFIEQKDLNTGLIVDYITNNVDYNYRYDKHQPIPIDNQVELKAYLTKVAQAAWQKQLNQVDTDFKKTYLERLAILKSLDTAWIEQVDNLQQLKSIVSNRSSGRHNTVFEYEKEANNSFNHMKRLFWKNMMRNILMSQLVEQKDGSVRVEFP